MRFGLRGRTLLVTVLTPLVLGLVTHEVMVREVRRHVDDSSIHESLAHTESVFEGMLATRSRALGGGAQVVVQDPRFFSLLMLAGAQRDARFAATVKGMAHDFNRITETAIFEVYDRHGALLASVGSAHSSRAARDALVRRALKGGPAEGVLSEPGADYQVAVAPARADGRVVGALLLGAPIGDTLASELRAQMRCDVSFLDGRTLTGSTLTGRGDRDALIGALAGMDLGQGVDLRRLGVMRLHGPSGTQLTIVRRLPGCDPALGHLYVLQRGFDPEARFQQSMQRDLVLLAALAVMVAILAGLVFGAQLLRPLRALVRAAEAMEAGDYEHPLDVRRRDELGYLAQRFVEMRRREKGYVESLERAAHVKNEFIRIASVQMRSPVGAISGFRDLFAGGQLGPVTPEQQRALEVMKSELERLRLLTDDATRAVELQGERLDIAREPIPVATLARLATGHAVAASPDGDRRFESRVEPDAGDVEVDAEQLASALATLANEVATGAETGTPVLLEFTAAEDALRIEVHDGATPPALRDAAAELRTESLGLAVTLARSVVEAHCGTLSARALPRGRRVFRVDVPPTAEPLRRAA